MLQLVFLIHHESVAQPVGWKNAVRALSSRNYRLFFSGQSVSLIGTWMTRVATSWLIYRLTHSPLLLGVASFAGQAPSFFLAPIAGVWIDRWNRHRTLVVTQILSMGQSFALAALALTGVITVSEVILLMLFQGVVNSFDMPARQSFVIQMVENRNDLPNAIALNSSMVNGARLVGPAVAGVLVGAAGEGYCFLADGISYMAVIVSLLLMHVNPQTARGTTKRVFDELTEGWRYVSGSVPIRSILLLLGVVSLFGMPYTVLMPVFASQVLHGGPHMLGMLMAVTGVGALFGALRLAGRTSVLGLGRVIPLASGVFGGALICFGLSRVLWISVVLLLGTGFGMMTQMASSNTILQTIVEEEKRGRVMAYYSMAFAGMAPFGSLLAGALAARVGAPNTVIVSGTVCIAGALWFAARLRVVRAHIRPIYVQLGIVKEVAAGIHQASILQPPPQD